MYLAGVKNSTLGTYIPAACPAGWVEADYSIVSAGGGYNNQRTCVSPTGGSHAVLYLTGIRNSTLGTYIPAACPAGWVEADYAIVSAGGGYNNQRTCFL